MEQAPWPLTGVLEQSCIFVHFVLRASICDRHNNFGNTPPLSVLNRERLLVGVLQGMAWSKGKMKKKVTLNRWWFGLFWVVMIWLQLNRERHDNNRPHFKQFSTYVGMCGNRQTCFGVSSTIANQFKSGHHYALVLIRVQPEFCLSIIAVLHKWYLFRKTREETISPKNKQLQ